MHLFVIDQLTTVSKGRSDTAVAVTPLIPVKDAADAIFKVGMLVG